MRILRKRIVLLPICVCITVGAAHAVHCEERAAVRADSLMNAANALYRQRKYDSAATAYLRTAGAARALPADIAFPFLRDGYYNAACCYSLLHNENEALRFLDSTIRHYFFDFTHIRFDGDLSYIRLAPGYDTLIAAAHLMRDSLAVYYRHAPPVLSAPVGFQSASLHPLFVVLHDGDGNPASVVRQWQPLADRFNAIIAAPYGVRFASPFAFSFGANADSADQAVLRAVASAEHQFSIDSSRVVIAGVGGGGFIAYQLAMKHPEIFHGALALNGFYNAAYCDEFIPTARKKGLCVAGVYNNDRIPVIASNIKAEETLRNAGMNANIVPLPPHANVQIQSDYISRALRWLLE